MSTLIAIIALGVLSLVLELLNIRKVILPIVLLGLAAILGMNAYELCQGTSLCSISSYNMIQESGFSKSFSILLILLAGLIIYMSSSFYDANEKKKVADFTSLKLFLLAGAVAMVSFANFIMFFLGLEVLSIAAYVLATSRPKNIKANEAGMKYFILGAVASSFVLFGLALVYGATKSFDVNSYFMILTQTGIVSETWYLMGLVMISIGMLFKCSIFPFHFWAPDVYQGSPTLTTSLMSTLVKVAALGSFFVIANSLLLSNISSLSLVIVILAVFTMFIANITALKQTNIKRMMAYSGISHAGFMLLTILMVNKDVAASTLLYYAVAYSIAALGVFAIIMNVCQNKDSEEIDNFRGLYRRNPLLTILMSLCLMSLGGIPVFAGFFAKLFLFKDLFANGMVWVVIFGVINSAIAIYYYFNVINVMFTFKNTDEEPTELEKLPSVCSYRLVAIVATIIVFVLGICPSLIIG